MKKLTIKSSIFPRLIILGVLLFFPQFLFAQSDGDWTLFPASTQYPAYMLANIPLVGIGTTLPQKTLHISHAGSGKGGGLFNPAGLRLEEVVGIGANTISSIWDLVPTAIDGSLNIESNSKALMTFSPKGFIGIGTKSPQATLDVSGDGLFAGSVGIGTSNPVSTLTVNGKITCEEVDVIVDVFPDYVFKDDYPLKSLDEVARYIDTHHHLPDVPTEKEVIQNGMSLGQMNHILLQKIEEMTLYLIDMNAQQQRLAQENEAMKQAIEALKQPSH